MTKKRNKFEKVAGALLGSNVRACVNGPAALLQRGFSVSALFVRGDSIYKELGVDCWDKERDASKWPGGNVCIVHPPCRAWGKFKGLAKPEPGEKELALLAIDFVRQNGGVLEHPASSDLFKYHLPRPGSIDEYGGFSICINQSWFGHPAEKRTLLYIVGVKERELPALPITFDAVCGAINPKRAGKHDVSKKWREATPPALAEWLVETCSIIHSRKKTQL